MDSTQTRHVEEEGPFPFAPVFLEALEFSFDIEA